MRGLVDMLLRGVVKSVTDSTAFQRIVVELRALDDPEDGADGKGIEHWLPYGYVARAKSGAEALVAYLGGDPERGVVLSVGDRRYRLTDLEEGEVAIHDDQGAKVHLTRDGIVIEPSSGGTVDLGGTGGAKVARDGDDVRVTVPAGTFIVSVSGGSGAPAVGTPNPEMTLDGTIIDGSLIVKAVD